MKISRRNLFRWFGVGSVMAVAPKLPVRESLAAMSVDPPMMTVDSFHDEHLGKVLRIVHPDELHTMRVTWERASDG